MIPMYFLPGTALRGKPRASGDDPNAKNREGVIRSKPRASGDDPTGTTVQRSP